MPLYTVVSEDYDVSVYSTLKALCDAEASTSLCIVPEDEFDDEAPRVLATSAAIKKAMRAHGEVKLSEDGDRDWKYKISRHD